MLVAVSIELPWNFRDGCLKSNASLRASLKLSGVVIPTYDVTKPLSKKVTMKLWDLDVLLICCVYWYCKIIFESWLTIRWVVQSCKPLGKWWRHAEMHLSFVDKIVHVIFVDGREVVHRFLEMVLRKRWFLQPIDVFMFKYGGFYLVHTCGCYGLSSLFVWFDPLSLLQASMKTANPKCGWCLVAHYVAWPNRTQISTHHRILVQETQTWTPSTRTHQNRRRKLHWQKKYLDAKMQEKCTFFGVPINTVRTFTLCMESQWQYRSRFISEHQVWPAGSRGQLLARLASTTL